MNRVPIYLTGCTFIDCPPIEEPGLHYIDCKFKLTNATLAYYAGRLIEPTPPTDDMPEGTYVRFPAGQWCQKNIILIKVELEDVPKDIRLHATLITGEF